VSELIPGISLRGISETDGDSINTVVWIESALNHLLDRAYVLRMRVARRNAEWLQALVPVQLNLNGGYHALSHLPTFSIDQMQIYGPVHLGR